MILINNYKRILVFFLFLLVITIPASFAGENDNLTTPATDESNLNLSSSDNYENLRADDVYFDASATADGTGSQSSPYKTVTSSKLGTNNHFAPGTYVISSSLSSLFSFSSSAMTFSGNNRDATILEYVGSGAFLTTSSDVTFSGITLKGASIVSTGGLLTATNTVFDSGIASIEEESDHSYYNNSYGGAIKQTITSSGFDWGSIWGGSTSTGLKIDNCIFRNNFAAYGGAIYLEGGNATITNTKFENNHATNGGGTISAMKDTKLTVTNCEFSNDYSSYDAGGAIYAFSAQSTIRNTVFSDCRATFGSAISSLNSTTTVIGSTFTKNRASWQGGAVYAMYGVLTISESDFNENSAKNGGAVFADNLTSFEVNGGTFTQNIAEDTAGAIFAFTNKVNRISTTYSLNSANSYDDLYQADKIDLVIGSDDYELIQYKSSYVGNLPSRYDLRSLGYVTPVKNQGQSGNCWAYATMATLESAILKATGKQYDLSEGNLKNLAARFSDIGWDYETNNGGMYPFVLGYLTSWAGPVEASLDPTDDWDVLAPIINSVVHVQNILFLQRTSFTDNSAIKKAIMDYGALCSEINWQSSYNSGTTDCYYSGTPTRNHAISVVGWDDSKTISGAPGAGAWIIKNSYGSNRGDGGYYYVSYYDTSLFRVYDESYNSFAIVFNDTQRFNKNYQYDAAMTDYFITGNKEMWYKNTFTATGNDILSAFSTYFRRVTTWEAQIFVNGELKLTQNGKTNFGYYTINLDEAIPLKIGDNFTVSLKISCNGLADIPISESGPQSTLVKEYFKEGVSFFSTDGVTWTDFYGYTSSYGSGETGHNYFNQVACLKAFTAEGPKETLNTTLSLSSVNTTVIVLNVKDQYGANVALGKITLTVDGVTYTVDVNRGMAILNTYLKAGTHSIQAKYIENQNYHTSDISRTVTLNKEDLILTISADNIVFGNDLEISFALTNALGSEIALPISVNFNNRIYDASNKRLTISSLNPGSYVIQAFVSGTDEYNHLNVSRTVTVLEPAYDSNVRIVAGDFDVYYAGESEFIAKLVDVEGNAISNQKLCINISGEAYIKTTDSNGMASLSLSSLPVGEYSVRITFDGASYYSSAIKFVKINIKSTIQSIDNVRAYLSGNDFEAVLKDSNGNLLANENVIFNVDGTNHTIQSNSYGVCRLNIDLAVGNHSITVYNPETGEIATFNADIVNRICENKNLVMDYADGSVFKVRVYGDNGSPVGTGEIVTFTVNGKTYQIETNANGYASLKITLTPKAYTIVSQYKGVKTSNKITVKPVLKAKNISKKKSKVIKFTATLKKSNGKALTNKKITFKIKNKKYSAKTNKKGIATISIKNLKVGKYTVTSYYLSSSVKNTIKIKK